MGACHYCQCAIEGEVDFHSYCPRCGKPLHSCVNCVFLAPGAYHDCHEGVEEEVTQKEEANFCDWFRLGSCGDSHLKKKEAALAKAEALFTF